MSWHRRQLIKQIEAAGGSVFGLHVDWLSSTDVRDLREGDHTLAPSAVRRWFGDKHISLIGFNRQLTDADRQAIQAFPEAQVCGIP